MLISRVMDQHAALVLAAPLPGAFHGLMPSMVRKHAAVVLTVPKAGVWHELMPQDNGTRLACCCIPSSTTARSLKLQGTGAMTNVSNASACKEACTRSTADPSMNGAPKQNCKMCIDEHNRHAGICIKQLVQGQMMLTLVCFSNTEGSVPPIEQADSVQPAFVFGPTGHHLAKHQTCSGCRLQQSACAGVKRDRALDCVSLRCLWEDGQIVE